VKLFQLGKVKIMAQIIIDTLLTVASESVVSDIQNLSDDELKITGGKDKYGHGDYNPCFPCDPCAYYDDDHDYDDDYDDKDDKEYHD
jgi:hypothetical protein